MYNRYLNANGFDEYFTPIENDVPLAEPVRYAAPPPTPSAAEPVKSRGFLGGLLGNLGDKIKLPDFDGDTILLLALVYFLVIDKDGDDEGGITNTLLIVGALLLLGF